MTAYQTDRQVGNCRTRAGETPSGSESAANRLRANWRKTSIGVVFFCVCAVLHYCFSGNSKNRSTLAGRFCVGVKGRSPRKGGGKHFPLDELRCSAKAGPDLRHHLSVGKVINHAPVVRPSVK